MTRKVPIVSTILVALAVAAMAGLGAWQLQRAAWKQGLIARYAAAAKMPPVTWPSVWPKPDDLPLFRYATGNCLRVVGKRSVAGANLRGETGYVHVVDCVTGPEGPGMSVELGWSANPNPPVNWKGGLVSGIIAPDRHSQMRLVAASAPPGLERSRPPAVESISATTPAGHRGYAATWFAFAVIAAVIYALALRKRWRSGAAAR